MFMERRRPRLRVLASGKKLFPTHFCLRLLMIFWDLRGTGFGLDLPDFGDVARFRRLPDLFVSTQSVTLTVGRL
jgi:hypothetical protein